MHSMQDMMIGRDEIMCLILTLFVLLFQRQVYPLRPLGKKQIL